MNQILIVTKNSTEHFAKLHAGGKGFNLFLLSNAGFTIPDWIVVTDITFTNFKTKNQINDYIYETLNNPQISIKEKSETIIKKIIETPFNKDEINEFKNIYNRFVGKCISVRSSAHDEDSALHSFAGQLSSYLYIDEFETAVANIKNVWASAFSERSLHYRVTNNLTITDIKVSVIFQEMIDPEISGVLFTCNPINLSNNEIVINSVYGVGEGLVSGLLDADTFILKKSTSLEIKEKNIVEKPKLLTRDKILQSTKEENVKPDLISISSLNDHHLNLLREIAIKIERFYNRAQDIEWAIWKDQVYILQSRPVTTEINNNVGSLFVWDNSNIVESYGGHTLPLTFGFAHYVYHQVYVQFCEILLVPQKNIKEMDYFLQNMLGLFYGRVYYNLLNWYKLTSILPGYKFNRGFMETMMGTNESLQDEIAERTKPPEFHSGILASLRKFLTGVKFLYFHFFIQSIVDKFLAEFHPIYNKFRKYKYEKMTGDQIYEKYMLLEKEMLWKWHAPIINDFLCMIHYGIFKKLTEKWLSHLGPSFHNDLLAGNGKLESAMPTKRLIELAGIVDSNKELKELILASDNSILLEVLNQSKHQEFYAHVQEYMDKYGFRCMSEMKLEQKDLHQDPSLFFIFLKNIIKSGQTNLHEFEKRETEIRQKAENDLNTNLSGFRKLIYSWSLRHARKAVMNRENTRFCRTRIYGVVRAMFYAIGEDFTKRNLIDCKEDIFYLNLNELKGCFEGTNTVQNLRILIEMRKKEYEIFKTIEPASRFMTRGAVYYNNQHTEQETTIENAHFELKENELKGIPCSPGIIEGIVKVILEPTDNMDLNGEILVTHRTDPGWIPLYPSASALLVERGGLLSHSAIVAREMGLPTIVSIKGLTKKLKTGMRIRMNGETGLIEILE